MNPPMGNNLKGYFDNLEAAANNDKQVLEDLVKSMAKVTETNEERGAHQNQCGPHPAIVGHAELEMPDGIGDPPCEPMLPILDVEIQGSLELVGRGKFFPTASRRSFTSPSTVSN